MLYSVNRKVQLTILFNNLLFSIGVRDVHGAIFLESIISSCNPIGIISRDPQGGITLHLTVTGIEEIVILADLCKALCTDIIREEVSAIVNCREAIFLDITILVTPVVAVFKACCYLKAVANVARSVHLNNTVGTAEHQTVTGFNSSVEPLAVHAVVLISVIGDESIAEALPCTGFFIEFHPYNIFRCIFFDRIVSVDDIAGIVRIQSSNAFNVDPFTGHQRSGPVVAGTLVGSFKCAKNQNAIIIKCIGVFSDGALAGMCLESRFVKIVVFCVQRNPAGGQDTKLGIVELARLLKKPRIRILARIDTISAKVIEKTIHLLDTGQPLSVVIVGIAIGFDDPSVLHRVGQRIAVLEGGVHITKPAALLGGIFRVYIRIETVGLLVFFLLAEGVQSAGTHINLIADGALICDGKTAVSTPVGVLLGGQLDTADNAQGVGSFHIQRLRLLLPVHGQRQGIRSFVKRRILQLKIVVDQLQITVIHIHALVECNDGFHLRQITDTLRKLHHEAPCRSIGRIRAGKHINQIVQSFRDGDLTHIDGKGIASNHVLGRIYHPVYDLVIRDSIGNHTVPSHLTVTTSGLVKVKGDFALIVQHNREGSRFLAKHSGDLSALQSRTFAGSEDKSINGAGTLAAGECKVTCLNGNLLVVVQYLHRQDYRLSKNYIDAFLGKIDILRGNNTHLMRANAFAVQHQINGHCTVAESGELAVLGNACTVFVRNSPIRTLGKLCLFAGGTDTLCRKLDRRAGGQIVIIGIHRGILKLSRAGSRGNHHQRGCDRTGKTIGRTVEHIQFLTRLLRYVGCGTAAVQIHCPYAACFKHDLGDFRHGAAAGIGFLTAIQNHHNHFTGSCVTYCSTRCSGGVVIAVVGDRKLAVLDQSRTEDLNSFLHLTLILAVVIVLSAHNGSTVLQNSKEPAGTDGVIFNTVHHQQSARLAGRHIKTGGVHADDHIVIFDVVFTVRVTVLGLSRFGLIQHTLHCPALAGVIVIIVCVNMNIISGDIRSGDEVSHLLTIRRGSIFHLLCDAGSQSDGFRGEHCVQIIPDLIHIVSCQLADIVRKSVAAGPSQIGNILIFKVSGALEGSDHFVACIGTVDSFAHIVSQGHAIQTVLQEISRPIVHGKAFGEVVLHNCCERTHFIGGILQGGHNIKGIQIAVYISL